jgi:hypothetical protein
MIGRHRIVAVVLALTVVGSPWLVAIPAALLKGIAVDEPCNDKIRRTGDISNTSHGDFRWWLPHWACVDAEGQVRATLPPWG